MREVDHAPSIAEAAIDLLKRDQIGADLADHLDRAARVAAHVGADALVDVVGADEQLGARIEPRAFCGLRSHGPNMMRRLAGRNCDDRRACSSARVSFPGAGSR
jgi:hypothetical protein